tara:strand:+ start:1030 stop:2271 length:1242 start_codon:yes stop_codon:yes gene_type:complete
MVFLEEGGGRSSLPAEPNVLLLVSGGIAAYKIPELVREFRREGAHVRCAMTESAKEFVSPLVLQTLSGEAVRISLLEPSEEGDIGHIDLADWADVVVVAPATANLMAKQALGIADDLVTTVLLATTAPIVLAPAMNVNMWENTSTIKNVKVLKERGVVFVGPEAGDLACGWQGMGRMSEASDIFRAAYGFHAPGSLKGERILVTAGGTREPIDPVRSLTNRSSGKMGYAVAKEAIRRGADVVLISAPTSLSAPEGVSLVAVETALEMRTAVKAEFEKSSALVMAAAVADFRPAVSETRKIKKEQVEGDTINLKLLRNPDILAEVSAIKNNRVVVGFAAESHNLVAAARKKIKSKGCDLLVANDISRSDAGFESDTNAVVFITPDGSIEELPLQTKQEVAGNILDRIKKLRLTR